MKLSITKIKKQSIVLLLLTTAVFSFFSCKTEFYDGPTVSTSKAGSIDPSKYVAVGTSITAGFADNALYNEGQANAYPNLIAQKFKEVSSALVFNQPAINSENGWSGGSLGKLVFVAPACSTVSISGVAQPGESSVLPNTGDKATLTNLAVPFLPITYINKPSAPAGSNFNQPKPYFDRVVSDGSLGIASEARKRKPTFFTVWIGYVDALQYATSGGTKPLLSTADFKQQIEGLLDSLNATPGAKGVIANVPYVDLFPIVTNNNRRLTSSTDPAKSPIRLTQEQADNYNTILGGSYFNGATGNSNNFLITTGAGKIRQINPSKDFIVRSNVLDSVGLGQRDPNSVRACTPNSTPRNEVGLKTPINNNAVLDADEIKLLRQQIDAYNQAIKEAVTTRNGGEGGSSSNIKIALLDLNNFYTKLTDPLYGIAYGSTIIRTNHPSLGPDFGGFFSLDRTHPTPKGQALIANEFIRTINSSFGASLNTFKPDDFRGNQLPGK